MPCSQASSSSHLLTQRDSETPSRTHRSSTFVRTLRFFCYPVARRMGRRKERDTECSNRSPWKRESSDFGENRAADNAMIGVSDAEWLSLSLSFPHKNLLSYTTTLIFGRCENVVVKTLGLLFSQAHLFSSRPLLRFSCRKVVAQQQALPWLISLMLLSFPRSISLIDAGVGSRTPQHL